MDLNTDASVTAAAEAKQTSEPETSQQPQTDSDNTPITSQPIQNEQQDPAPATAPTPAATDSAPSLDAPPKDHLAVIDERMETSNGVCTAPTDSPPSSSSPRQQHAKPSSSHANGRARLSSRSGSVSHGGSPRPSLSRQPSAATDPGADAAKPNDYLVWAILACLCPVWPINIVGLTFSVMNAKILSIVSLIGGIIIIIVTIVINWGVILKT
ncbi:hypothetical protein DNTS_017837 [Danionella cerebrum]|uniref:Uncharacterized protein n=1 Tax=Danionella cerebrum TaxID=2873325 RepID=A0A553R092_9TELE|nr:hypothetical protein DNTS_017837 [Danionella translucida]